jgi:hypothetical protein
MLPFEEEAQKYLSERRQEIEEAKYRVEMKHSLRKAGIVHEHNLSTAKLEEMCVKYL